MGFQTIFIYIASLITFLFIGTLIYFQRQFSYWGRRKVAHIKPSFFTGNFGGLGSKWSFTEMFINLYEEKKHERFCGIWIFHKPGLLINDPELIRQVLIQDFSNFEDHSAYYNEKDDPLSAHLFSLRGALCTVWRSLRTKLTPGFTSGKMKAIFSTVVEVGELLQTVLDPIAEKQGVIETKDTIARFSIDVVGTVAFGIKTGCLENPNSLFKVMVRKITEPKWDVMARAIIAFLVPDLANALKLRVFDKDLSKFFLGAMRDTIDFRKENNQQRNDLMQILMELMEKGSIDDDNPAIEGKDVPFSFHQLAAQAFIFFIAGFESTSSTVQFALYELAKNSNIQDKLREEILNHLAKNNGKLTYEGLNDLKYTQMVLEESLRKYPPAGIINRECNQDYKIPETEVVIEKGTAIYISVPGLHRDSRYFPEPEEFKPERFCDEGKAELNNYVYLPFGEGPRVCIGFRFAFMQMKVALVSLISKYRFEFCEKTPKSLKFDPKSIILLPSGGMHLRIIKL